MAKFYIIRNRVPFSIRLQMYKSLADSIISYGLSSYGRTFKTYLDQIYKLQVRLLKMVVPYNLQKQFRNDQDLFKFCKTLPIHIKFKYEILKEQFFRADIQHPITHCKVTRQITNQHLKTPKFCNYYGKRTSEYIIPELINQLPINIRQTLTPKNITNILKREFATHLD